MDWRGRESALRCWGRRLAAREPSSVPTIPAPSPLAGREGAVVSAPPHSPPRQAPADRSRLGRRCVRLAVLRRPERVHCAQVAFPALRCVRAESCRPDSGPRPGDRVARRHRSRSTGGSLPSADDCALSPWDGTFGGRNHRRRRRIAPSDGDSEQGRPFGPLGIPFWFHRAWSPRSGLTRAG